MMNHIYYSLLLSLFLCLFPTYLWANISEPPRTQIGQIAGNTGIANIAVDHELLQIDLHPLLDNKPILVKATYTLQIEEPLENIPLIFIANNLENNAFQISLNGKVIEGDTSAIKHAPSKWFPPDTIQWRDQSIPFKYQNKGFVVFHLPKLEKGKQILEVSYKAVASQSFRHPLVNIWEFVYILQPTTAWKRFQNLDLQVLIPNDWEHYSNIPLEKKDNIWVGSWQNLPAHHFAISCNKKVGWLIVENAVIRIGQLLLFLITVLSLLFWIVRRRVRYQKGPLLEGLAYILIVLVGAVVLNVIFFTQSEWWWEQLGWQTNPNLGRGGGYIIILTVPVTALILAIIIPVVIHFMKKYLIRKYQKT